MTLAQPPALPPVVVRRRRADLVRQASAAGDVSEVFSTAAKRLRGLVPYDAAAWVVTDPATGLPGAPSLLENFSAPLSVCSTLWHREFVQPDINRFPQLTRAAQPAAALRATAVDPTRSARYRWFLEPLGFGDELRAVLRAGDTPWAMATFWRREGGAAFTTAEAELVGSLSEPLGAALRRQVRTGFAAEVGGAGEQPGLLMFDEDGRLISANEHAAAWLEELPQQELVPTQYGLQLPLWLLVTAVRARESLLAGGDGLARTRVRSQRGRWLVGHASTTRDAAGSPAGTALVLEPASPALLAPIMVDAYGLTDREQEITRLIARGAGTDEIATALFLSPHTVRDHVKSILHKMGVSSRGELVATLYTDQFEPAHLAQFSPVARNGAADPPFEG